ncbi:MAG: hypothetical protein HY822_16535 [Acidobacteria bacterium]|nr:hypothetical protein [Acidobacteriota bacterium]
MATTRQTKRDRLRALVESRPPGPVTADEWESLRAFLAPVSESYLRDLLRDLGVPMEPLVGGVDQTTFESLEASLLALLELYRGGAGRPCRRIVIQAKDHARWASRRAKDEARREQKREMAEWMRVWLENPEVFPGWVRLRKRAKRWEENCR